MTTLFQERCVNRIQITISVGRLREKFRNLFSDNTNEATTATQILKFAIQISIFPTRIFEFETRTFQLKSRIFQLKTRDLRLET